MSKCHEIESIRMSQHDTLHSLEVNLLSHFFVNLRTAGAILEASTMSDPRFARIVGNLANTLSYSTDNEPGTGDEEEAEGVEIEGDRCPDDGLKDSTGGRVVEELKVGDEGSS